LATTQKLPKAQRHLEKSNVSEQQVEQTSGGSSVAEEPVATSEISPEHRDLAGQKPEAIDPAVPTISPVASPMIAADHEAPKADDLKPETIAPEPIRLAQIKAEPLKVEPGRIDPIKTDTIDVLPPKAEPTKTEAPKTAVPKIDVTRNSARLVMASPANDSVHTEPRFPRAEAPSAAANVNAKPEVAPFIQAADAQAAGGTSGRDGQAERADPAAQRAAARRALPVAAMLALALAAGAAGGALATAAIVHGSARQATAAGGDSELSASVARLENDIATLKAGLEQTNQTSLVELNKTSERLDKVEKTQGELAKAGKPGELQKLSETVERLRAAQASAGTTAREPKETTGSVPSSGTSQAMASAASAVAPAQAAAARTAAASRPDDGAAGVGRLPIVEGWVLRDVGRGGALIEGRQGLYEVYAGDPVPGLGKVDAIRKQDGRWVVVTTRGLVVAR
jgi:hypothetical protein